MRNGSPALDIDFTVLPNGPLPSSLLGSTWAVVDGKAVNTPTLGAELLTDTGLEQAYSAGLCGSLSLQGAATVAEETSDVRGGSKAQRFTSAGFASLNRGVTGVKNAWYQYAAWSKRLSGTGNNTYVRRYQPNAIPTNQELVIINSADWQRQVVNSIATSTDTVILSPAYSIANPGDAVVVDDHELKIITESSLYALSESLYANATVKVKINVSAADATYVGLVLRANARTNLSNSIEILARQRYNSSAIDVIIVKKVAGNYSATPLLSPPTIIAVAGAWLEARVQGETLKLYYNGAQVGSDVTLTDPELLSGTHHGLISGGGNSVNRFFVAPPQSEQRIAFAGSSFASGYTPLVQEALSDGYARADFVFTNGALGGHNTWSSLVRLGSLLSQSPQVIVLDHANDANDEKNKSTMEAFVRRAWTALPSARLLLIESPSWLTQNTSNNAIVDTPTNLAVIEWMHDIAMHYGIPVAPYWEWCKSVIPDPYDLTDLTADTVHPTNAIGYPAMADVVLDYLPNGGVTRPNPLPARLYADTENYERTPTRLNGTGYTSRTGTWTDTGTRTQSSEAGATITFTTTCQSVGCYRADSGTNNVQISVDDGAYRNVAYYQNGAELAEGYGEHNLTFKVVSGTVRIDEFWAV